MRGTFGNIRLRNRLVEGKEGPYTLHLPDGEQTFIYDAAMRYRDEGVPLVVIAGKRVRLRLVARLGRQGHHAARRSAPSSPRPTSGSTAPTSSGWACCRSSSCPARARRRLGLTGREAFTIVGPRGAGAAPGGDAWSRRSDEDGSERAFRATARLDGPIEVEYLRQGGILPAVLRRLAAD